MVAMHSLNAVATKIIQLLKFIMPVSDRYAKITCAHGFFYSEQRLLIKTTYMKQNCTLRENEHPEQFKQLYKTKHQINVVESKYLTTLLNVRKFCIV